jgi:phage shock protein C
MKKLQALLESQGFEVCTHLGEKMGICTANIRLYFIYLSFLTFGSPIVVYLSLAFLMNMRRHFRKEKSSVWDL